MSKEVYSINFLNPIIKMDKKNKIINIFGEFFKKFENLEE
jgi:hypothetical protein